MPNISVKLHRLDDCRARASVHMDFFELSDSGMTISNILVQKENGNLMVKMPLTGGTQKHPSLTVRGELKNALYQAIAAEFESMERWQPIGV